MQQPRQTRVTGGIRLQPAHRHPTSQPAHRQHTSELEHLELGDTFIEARAGVQLVLSYDAPTDYGGKGTFRGTVKNTKTPLHRVIVEVWLYFAIGPRRSAEQSRHPVLVTFFTGQGPRPAHHD